MDDLFLIAEVKTVYDSNGYIAVVSYSDFPERFFELKHVLVPLFGEYRRLLVEDVRQIDNEIIIKFNNFNSDKDAEFLVGKKIFVEHRDAVSLSEDCYFIHDLIGSKVYKNKMFFGYLVDVLSLPANDVYVIKDKNGKEALLPALRVNIEKFSPNEKMLILTSDSELVYSDEN